MIKCAQFSVHNLVFLATIQIHTFKVQRGTRSFKGRLQKTKQKLFNGWSHNTIIKSYYYPHLLTPPPSRPYPHFFLLLFFLLLTKGIKIFWNRPNTTKYALKSPKLPKKAKEMWGILGTKNSKILKLKFWLCKKIYI